MPLPQGRGALLTTHQLTTNHYIRLLQKMSFGKHVNSHASREGFFDNCLKSAILAIN